MSGHFRKWLHLGRFTTDRCLWNLANHRQAMTTHRRKPLSLASLERRLLMSATPIDPALMTADPAESGGQTSSIIQSDRGTTNDATTLDTTGDLAVEQASVVVIVDQSIPDLAAMLSDLQQHASTAEVFVLDSDRDGIDQISGILQTRSDIDAVHLITHGDGDSIRFGNTLLDDRSITAYSGSIAAWRGALSDNADLMFYGCDLAGTASGRTLLESISALTGADVAASNNDTGHASFGADWELEFSIGEIDHQVILSESFQDNWQSKLSVITVTTASGVNDTGSTTFDIGTLLANRGTDGQISLSEAIIAANNSAGADTIWFDIGGGGLQVIQLGNALPAITDTIILDGTTQTGFVDQPLIHLDGMDLAANGLTLVAGSAGSTIRGLGIANFDFNGIHVLSSGNTIAGNWIGGFDPSTGARESSRDIDFNGIFVTSSGNTIGGVNAVDRNVIGELDLFGIALIGSDATDNLVQGNWIGITPDGNADAPVELDGIALLFSADDNTIANNVVGNARHGIHLFDASNNVLIGNAVGTDFSQTHSIGNAQKGIRLAGDSDDNEIGQSGQGNLIVGNGMDGIAVLDTSTGNTIRFNEITGNADMPIDLGGDGTDVNDVLDTDTGANQHQNRPVLSSATVDSTSQLTVVLQLNSAAMQTYRIDFYEASQEPGSYGDPLRYIGYSIINTSVTGNASVIASGPIPGLTGGELMVATATDSGGNTSEFSSSVLSVLVNTAPVLSDVETMQLDYVENSGPQPISSSITVFDADGVGLQSATVSIGGFRSDQDVLGFTDTANISGSWNASTGVLTLSGKASVSEYQDALRSVTYRNTSENPTTSDRTISFTVFDGAVSSTVVNRVIVPSRVNDQTVGGPVLPTTVSEDQTITVDTSSISDLDGVGSFSFQWYSDGNAIAGATTDSFTPNDQHVGGVLTVSVSFVDGMGNSISLTSSPTADVQNVDDLPSGSALINGTPTEDQVLSVDTSGITDDDGLSAPDFSYQWFRDGTVISAANGSSYTLGASDVNSHLTVMVTFTDDQLTSHSIESDPVGPITMVNHDASGTPTIIGVPTEDQLLSVSTTGISDPDGMTNPNFTFQWYRDGVAVSGATSLNYQLDDADVGSLMSVSVTYSDDRGFSSTVFSPIVGPVANVNDLPVGLPVVAGTLVEGQPLTGVLGGISDADGLPATADYQWLRDGVEIKGASEQTYTLTINDVGHEISVRVIYQDLQGTIETVVSAPTKPIDNLNDAPTLKDRTREIRFGETLKVGTRLFEHAAEDADGDTLKAVLVEGPSSGKLMLRSDGAFQFTPDPDFIGTVTFTWQADDGESLSNVATVTIVITPPIITPGSPTGPNGDSGGEPTDPGSSAENDSSDGSGEGTSGLGGNSAGTDNSTPTGGGGTTPDEPGDQDGPTSVALESDGGSRLLSFRPTSSDDDGRLAIRGGLDDRLRESDGINAADRNSNRNAADRILGSMAEAMPWATYALLGSPGQMWDQLDSNQHQLETLLEGEQLIVGSFGAATGGFTVIALAWLRSGFLVLGFWQQRPLWSRMDPLVLMQGLRSNDDESLEDVIADQRRKLDQQIGHDETE